MKKLLLYFFSHRTLALIRWDLHFLSVRINSRLFSRTSRLLDVIKKKGEPLYLNLGSGPRGLDAANWVNVDGFKDTNVHYLCDFGRPLPFRIETFDSIFCEHVLEHFIKSQRKKFINRMQSYFKEGGSVKSNSTRWNKNFEFLFQRSGQNHKI